jgi:muramoyltetrapeptide carboxypeptidase LdcA involved in peptidoglycan recycling
MIKGCQKKIIFLESTKSKYFDQAYLVMKDDLYSLDEGEILKEAEKIIFGAEHCQKEPKKKSNVSFGKSALVFTFGLFLGLSFAFLMSFFII